MSRKIFQYAAIFLLLASVFAGIQLYNDAKLYGFFTVTETHSVITNQRNHLTDTSFQSLNPHLGILSMKLDVKKEGSFIFRIKDTDNTQWYYQQQYNTKQIKYLEYYPFGFPPINNSLRKTYNIQIESIGNSRVIFNNNDNQTTIISRHVFSKGDITHSVSQLGRFLQKRISSVLLDNKQWFINTLGAYLFVMISIYIANDKNQQGNVLQLLLLPQKKHSRKGYIFLALFLLSFVYGNIFLPFQSDTIVLLTSVLWILTILYAKLDPSTAFLSSCIVLLTLPCIVLLGAPTIAARMSLWVWIFLLSGVIQHVVTLSGITNKIIHGLQIIRKQSLKDLLVKGFFIVFLISLLTAALSKTYYLGGDDSKLYYLYPLDFYNNFVSKTGPDSAVSSIVSLLPPMSIAPLILLFTLVKGVLYPFNIEMILFTLNIFGGLISFYLLVNYFNNSKSVYASSSKIIGSVMYVFSIFNYYTLYNSKLLTIYLISIFPLSLYLFLKGVRERKAFYVICAAFLWSLFCFLSASLPWLAGVLLSIIPFVIYFFWENKKRFVLYGCIFFTILVLLNGYWMVSLSNSQIRSSAIKPSIESVDFRKANADGIRATASRNNILYPLLNLYHYNIQKDFNWAQLQIFEDWYIHILPLNIVFLLPLILAIVLMGKQKKVNTYVLVSLCSLLISIYFFTVNITPFGIDLFVFLNNYVPGFVMFRNMYDKFGYAIAFCYALAMTCSLIYLTQEWKSVKLRRYLLLIIFGAIILNAKPFIFDEFNKLPIWTTKNTYSSVQALNKDFLSLTTFVKENEDASRYLWLPLNYGNISQIQDEVEANHYYHGIGPLTLLSGKNDYTGTTSFEGHSDTIKEYIIKRKYKELGLLYQKFNVKYIIVNHTIGEEWLQSYICGELLCEMQDKQYQQAMLGRKIKDFGKRYSLYEINPQYTNEKIFLTDDYNYDINNKETDVTYKKISSNEYQVSIHNLIGNKKLVLLDPYFDNWDLKSLSGATIKKGIHDMPFGYANGWTINKNDFSLSDYNQNPDGSVSVNLKMVFENNVLYYFSLIISLVTYILIGTYIGLKLVLYLYAKIKGK